MMSDYKVEMINDGMQEFYVHFHGPNESKFPFSQFFLNFFLLVSVIVVKYFWVFFLPIMMYLFFD
jgi:hypothetical protein